MTETRGNFTRRRILRAAAAAAASASLPPNDWRGAFAKTPEPTPPGPGETESHGLSTFGDLGEPVDYRHFGYVNPNAPKGGVLALSPASPTFNTFNAYVLRGNPATGMSLVFDTLMNQSLDERDAYYGLVARKVRISADRLTYTFFLRPEARFHNGAPLTAHDVAFSLKILKSKGHPVISQMLRDLASAEAAQDDILVCRFAPGRSRDLPLTVANQPIFSRDYYATRDFEATTLEPPLGSGPYKVGAFDQGHFIAYERVPDYWARNLPIAVGQGNFDTIRFEYFGDSQVAFEGFKAGAFTEREENIARVWATGYDFPAVRDGRVKRATTPNNNIPSIQGWVFNTRRPVFRDPAIREAIGYAFDYEWTSRNLMYDAYRRISSYFENSELAAVGTPDADQIALLEPFRAQLPAEVFGEPFVAPVSDGSGQDRALLKKASDLLNAAGCQRRGSQLYLADGTPLVFEFLDNSNIFERHTQPFIKNLKLLGITATMRVVDAAQYKKRLEDFDFDIVHDVLMMAWNPGEELRAYFDSSGARVNGSRNLPGIAHPAVDAMVEKALKATSRQELVTTCRALDRVLRSQRYWVPHWYNPVHRYAYWDLFGQPERQPKFDTGVLWTWWWDAEKARKANYRAR